MMAYEDTEDYKNLIKAQAREGAEPGTESTSDFMKRTGTKANPPMARTYTSKGPVVTKEQMKKAGFDNLRDYLNAEKGLTRRDDKAQTPAKKKLPGKAAEGQMGDVVGAKKGGSVKSSASKRADGIAQRGKTRGRMV
jgi:hypothetical protein